MLEAGKGSMRYDISGSNKYVTEINCTNNLRRMSGIRHFIPKWPLLLLSHFSRISDSVKPHKRQPTRLPGPWDSPGKNTGVGCRFLLQQWPNNSTNCLISCFALPCSLFLFEITLPKSTHLQALVPNLFYGEGRLNQLLLKETLRSGPSRWESGALIVHGAYSDRDPIGISDDTRVTSQLLRLFYWW